MTALFFESPLNAETLPAEAGDNCLSTWTTETTVEVSLETTEKIEAVWCRCSDVASYTLTVDGTLIGTRTLPASVETPEGTQVSITRNGWQHDYWTGEFTPQAGQKVSLEFTAVADKSLRVSDVMLLKKGLELDIYNQVVNITHARVDSDLMVLHDVTGGVEVRTPTDGDTQRWSLQYEAIFAPEHEMDFETFLDWIEDHPNFFFIPEYKRYPWRAFPAVFLNKNLEAPYVSDVVSAGNRVRWTVNESRADEPLELPRQMFNSTETGLQFFQECVHLGDNGDIDDNDFATFSSEAEHILELGGTDMSHLWLKSEAVASVAVYTETLSVWTLSETLVPPVKVYRGWSSALMKLTKPLTKVERVRLVATPESGKTLKISEVMCLQHAGGIANYTEAFLTKEDRAGTYHQSSVHRDFRTRNWGAGRYRWKVDVTATWGHLNQEAFETFLEWMQSYPQFVVALSAEHPWRTFPAAFTSSRYDAVFLTSNVTDGVQMQFQILER